MLALFQIKFFKKILIKDYNINKYILWSNKWYKNVVKRFIIYYLVYNLKNFSFLLL